MQSLLVLYGLSFIIFFTKDKKIRSKYWSQHDVFHLIVTLNKILTLYYINWLKNK
jgi:hypothetical protein